MSTTTHTKPPDAKGAAKPAVKISPDVHRAIGLRKLRDGGKIEDHVDTALRAAFAKEIEELAR